MAQSRLSSIAAAAGLALSAACVDAEPRDVVPEMAPVASAAAPSAPPAAVAPPVAELEPVRAGPLGALNQMVTTQALLVSLFLAPVSRDGSQMMAHADASASDGGTHPRQ
jgi:hypothetical protein